MCSGGTCVAASGRRCASDSATRANSPASTSTASARGSAGRPSGTHACQSQATMTAWTANTVSPTARTGPHRLARVRGMRNLDRRRVRAGRRDAVCERDHAAAFALANGIGRNRDMHGSLCSAESFPCRTARNMPMGATSGRPRSDAAAHRYATARLLHCVPPVFRLCRFGSATRRHRPRTALSSFATLRPRLSPNATHADHPRHARARRHGTCNRPLGLARRGARRNGMRFA